MRTVEQQKAKEDMQLAHSVTKSASNYMKDVLTDKPATVLATFSSSNTAEQNKDQTVLHEYAKLNKINFNKIKVSDILA